MATRGRKPLPTALKELEGDRGKGRRPLNKDEPNSAQKDCMIFRFCMAMLTCGTCCT